jgi:hypothetical protein
MNQEGMFKPALIAGILIGILSALPFVNLLNCLCCVWVIGGAAFAAHLYVQSSPMIVTLGQGVVLGLLAGAIGGAVQTLFSIPLHLMMAGMGTGAAQQILEQILPNMPAESRETMRSIIGSTGTFGMVFWILSGIMTLILYSLIGMIGGAIGVALFEKRKPQPLESYQPPVAPPPPPTDYPPQV